MTERRHDETIPQTTSLGADLWAFAFEGSGLGLWDWDVAADRIVVSTGWKDLFCCAHDDVGLSHEEWRFRVHPDDRGRVMAAIERHFQGETAMFASEHRMRCKDGSYKWVLERGKIVSRTGDGKPLRVLGTHTDITERKQTEEGLTRSRDLLKSFVEHTPAAVAMFDKNLRYVAVSKRWLHDYNLGDQDLIGRHHYDVFPEIRQCLDWQAVHQRCLTGAVESRQEDCFARKDGTKDWLRWEVRPWHDETNVIGGIMMFTEVITRRKQAEERLRQTQFAMDQAVDAIYWVDPEAKIFYANEAASLMVGYSKDELLGMTVHDLNPDFPASMWRDFWEETRRNKTMSFQTNHRAKDGRLVPIDIRVSFLAYEGREFHCAFVRDITERKLSEAALALAARDLEQKNKELAVARDKALEAVKVKAEFLATMSHEIRTPMNGIIGMTGLLLDTSLTSEQREYAETVRLSSEHLLDIINEILDFSKIEAGKLGLEEVDFDLHTAVEDAIGLLGERAYAKGLELTCLVQAGVPTALRGDPGRLRQILVNLIDNAVKFTEQGEVVVTVGLEEEPDEVTTTGSGSSYRTLRFKVTDTGVGITPEQQAKLFLPFTQADGSSTRKYGGIGVGLAICKQLVEMMGGRIGVDSQVQEGSVFWFTVRFLLQPERAQPIARTPAALQGHRILIVDDHATNRRVLEQSLRGQGVMYESAENGHQALDRLRDAAGRKTPFDLAILDMQMPGMDGLELACRIKSEPMISATRLVLLTSVGRRGDAKAAQSAGIAAYLTKPIRQSLLYECLSLVLGSVPHTVAPTPQAVAPFITRHSLSEAQARSRPLVLVVEDNPVNQKVAANMIEKLGYRVNVAANGREAVDSLARIPYALVFMDCQMPEMDGFEATAVIRQREALLVKREAQNEIRLTSDERRGTHRVPIIAMTANATQEDRDRCRAAGMDDFLGKPVTSKSLAAILDRWLPHDQIHAEAESKAAQ